MSTDISTLGLRQVGLPPSPAASLIAALDAAYPRADMKHSWWLGNGLIEVEARKGYVLLVGFWVSPNRRHLGHGSLMLDTLCALADRLGVTIRTWADPYDADREARRSLMKAAELREWYARWGFLPNGRRAPIGKPKLVRRAP